MARTEDSIAKRLGSIAGLADETACVSGRMASTPDELSAVFGRMASTPNELSAVFGRMSSTLDGTAGLFGTMSSTLDGTASLFGTMSSTLDGAAAVFGPMSCVPDGTPNIPGTMSSAPDGTPSIPGTLSRATDAMAGSATPRNAAMPARHTTRKAERRFSELMSSSHDRRGSGPCSRGGRRRGSLALFALSILGVALGCTGSTALKDIDVGLPVRAADVDTSAVTATVRENGGNVFVKLTGEPTEKAIEVLGRAGLMPPILPDSPKAIVTFPDLKIATVAGYVRSGGVKDIALLPFVVRIEPSGGAIGSGRVRVSR
jgi:hypothetical protein